MPKEVGAALLASAEGYTPRATQLLEAARERLGTIQEVAGWIAESLPQPKTGPSRARRRRRRKKKGGPEGTAQAGETKKTETAGGEERPGPPKKRRRRRKKPAEPGSANDQPQAPKPEAPARAEDAA
jgi:hypothetical protein